MKYIKGRGDFLKRNLIKINEEAPFENTTKWGDSWIGRIVNSLLRKSGIGVDLVKIESVIKELKRTMEDIDDGISKIEEEAATDPTTFKTIISNLVEELKRAVERGDNIESLIQMTTITIEEVEKVEIENKENLIKALKDFLLFLESLKKTKKGDDPNVDPDPNEEDPEKTKEKNKMTFYEKISLLNELKSIIDNKDYIKTQADVESKNKEIAKDANYIINQIINKINDQRDKKFNNDLLGNSKSVKWPIIEASGNDVIYRKSKKILELTNDKKINILIPKYDEAKGEFTGDIKPRVLDFNKETIALIAKYVIEKMEIIKDSIDNNSMKPNEKEVEWFNNTLKGKWIANKSKGSSEDGAWYIKEIESIDIDGTIQLKNYPKNWSKFTLSRLFKSKIFSKEDAQKFYQEKWKSGENVFNKDGKIANNKKDTKEPENTKPNPNIANNKNENPSTGGQMSVKDGKVKNKDVEKDTENQSESYSLYQDYEFILEKETTIYKNETYLTQAWVKLKGQLEAMMNEDKGVSVNSQFISDVLTKAYEKDENDNLVNTKLVKTFFSDIKKEYGNIGDMGKLYITENISSQSTRLAAAEKIARFAKVAMLFEQVDENLYGGLGDLGKSLEKFNTLFKKLLNEEIAENFNNKFKLFSKYNEFRSWYIKEEKEEISITEKIKNKFVELIDVSKYVLSKEEQDKINQEFQKKAEELKKGDRVVYLHDVVRIVRCFNKAYKIHTTQVIPTGRSDGKVSNSVFREYQCFGNGTPKTAGESGGPYRNRALFNKWESAVLDILDNEEYNNIFLESTKVGENSKDGGKKLKEFMINMLDGENLYKGTSGGYSSDAGTGQQAKYLKEFFGIELKGVKDEGDGRKIEKLSGGINTKETDWKLVKSDPMPLKEGNIFIMELGNDENLIGWVIRDPGSNQNNEYVDILISSDFTTMKNFINKYNNEISVKTPNLSKFKNNNNIYGTLINNKLKKGKIEIKSYEIGNNNDELSKEEEIKNLVILKIKDSDNNAIAKAKDLNIIDQDKMKNNLTKQQ
jgi:hypothetical protein